MLIALLAVLLVRVPAVEVPMQSSSGGRESPGMTSSYRSAWKMQLFSDDFESYPQGEQWRDGSLHGPWRTMSSGYGSVGIAEDNSHVLRLAPATSAHPDETHAALVTTVPVFDDLDLRVRVRTVRQLRTPKTNPWEVGWVLWNYAGDTRAYYVVLKPNGWELGKLDATPMDPLGPACTWPEYVNCRYPGAQRLLATGMQPSFAVGPWHEIQIRQVKADITVAADGTKLTSFTDSERPYHSGAIGLYTEDAEVFFDSVTVALP